MGMRDRKKLLGLAIAVPAAAVIGWFLVPKIGELGHTFTRVKDGSPGWLLAAVGLEALSFLGHVVLFRAVGFGDSGPHRPARESRDHDRPAWRRPGCWPAPAPAASRSPPGHRRSGMEGATVAAPDDLLPGAPLQHLHGARCSSAASASRSGCSPAAARSRSPSCRPTFGAVVIGACSARCGSAARRGRPRAAAVLAPLGARRARRAPHGALRRRRPGRRDHVVGLRHRRPVGVLPRVRRLAGDRGARRRLLRRHARQHAAAARRDRRRRGRHGRRARRLRGRSGPRPDRRARLPRLRLLAADPPRRHRLPHPSPHGGSWKAEDAVEELEPMPAPSRIAVA